MCSQRPKDCGLGNGGEERRHRDVDVGGSGCTQQKIGETIAEAREDVVASGGRGCLIEGCKRAVEVNRCGEAVGVLVVG